MRYPNIKKNYIEKKLTNASISKIIIERAAKKIRIIFYTSRPGIIIGKRGSDIESLKKMLSAMTNLEVFLDIKEIRKPEVEAKLVADNVANQLERRISYSRAMKRAIGQAMRQGAQGIKIMVAGRLGGIEMSRRNWMRDGRVPLQTLRADIDYALSEANTTYGKIGVKVWVYRGEVLPDQTSDSADVYVST